MSKRKQPELELQKAVVQFLNVALPEESFWTAFPAGGGGFRRGQRLKVSGLKAGFPDLLIVHDGQVICIELKAPAGYLSVPQQCTINRLMVAGAKCFLAKSVEEVENDLISCGITLRASVAGWVMRRNMAKRDGA